MEIGTSALVKCLWLALENLLGTFSDLLGHSWDPLGVLFVFLGCSWGLLAPASWSTPVVSSPGRHVLKSYWSAPLMRMWTRLVSKAWKSSPRPSLLDRLEPSNQAKGHRATHRKVAWTNVFDRNQKSLHFRVETFHRRTDHASNSQASDFVWLVLAYLVI